MSQSLPIAKYSYVTYYVVTYDDCRSVSVQVSDGWLVLGVTIDVLVKHITKPPSQVSVIKLYYRIESLVLT